MSSNKPVVDFASLIAPHPATRTWPNLDAYGIALQIAIYQTGREDIVVTDAQSHGDKLEKLGFTKINGEWTLPHAVLFPREVLRVFPKATMNTSTLASNIFVDRTGLMPPAFEEPKTRTLKSTVQARLNTRIEAAADFNSLIAPRAATQRWMNLEAYGIEAKIAIYNDGSDLAHIVGGDEYTDKLKDIGFTKIGDEWTIPLVRLQPRAVLQKFPDMIMEKEMLAEKVFVDRTHLAAPDLPLTETEKRIIAHSRSRLEKENQTSPAPRF